MSKRGGGSNPISLFSFQDIITSVTGIMILVTLMMTLELLQRTHSSAPVQTPLVTNEAEEALEAIKRRIEEEKKTAQLRLQTGAEVVAVDADPSKMKEMQEALAALVAAMEHLEKSARNAEHRHQKAQELKVRTQIQFDEIAKLSEDVRRKQEELQKLKSGKRIVYNRDSESSKQAWLIDLSDGGIKTAAVGISEPPRQFSGESGEEFLTKFDRWLVERNPVTEYFVILIRSSAVELQFPVQEVLRGRGFEYGYDLLGDSKQVIDDKTGAAAP